ncbi:hypothetical protein PRUB_a5050 [Pseudoalteromonas rubra]|uniref:Uncharacterized protein n=1 Tax=Pseudoalteromonas rubra TaxID=43658 RepID=A0A8T0C3R5_9GAMM|nr:hypothetical protein PRUB_a5050 [Pseudoalteromonas rubra]
MIFRQHTYLIGLPAKYNRNGAEKAESSICLLAKVLSRTLK